MQNIFRLIFVVLTLAALSQGACNINGTTGYVVMPSGDGLKAQEYRMGLSVFSKTKYVNSFGKYDGAFGTPSGTEIGLSGRSEREGVFINIKWFGSLNDYEDPLMVGMGFENLSSLGTYGDFPNMYMVVTKKFMTNNSFSIGSVGRYIDKNLKVSLMTGLEWFWQDNFSSVIDLVAYENETYNSNIGLRYFVDNKMYFSLNVINAGRNDLNPDLHPTVTTLGLTYNNFM